MSLVFLTHSVLSVLSVVVIWGIKPCDLPHSLRMEICFLSYSALCWTVAVCNHRLRFSRNRFYLWFRSLVVNIRYCAVSAPMMNCDARLHCDALTVDWILFHVKWVCVCACRYRTDPVGHGLHPTSPLPHYP